MIITFAVSYRLRGAAFVNCHADATRTTMEIYGIRRGKPWQCGPFQSPTALQLILRHRLAVLNPGRPSKTQRR